jgi:hypothetical protein
MAIVWSVYENRLFEEALSKYGKNLTMLELHIKTKTEIQIKQKIRDLQQRISKEPHHHLSFFSGVLEEEYTYKHIP